MKANTTIYKQEDGGVMIEICFEGGRVYLDLQDNIADGSWGVVTGTVTDTNRKIYMGLGGFGEIDLRLLKEKLEGIINGQN